MLLNGFEKYFLIRGIYFLYKKRIKFILQILFSFLVEQQGFEPWSKHGINMLSTCLAAYWFSTIVRKVAPKLSLIS